MREEEENQKSMGIPIVSQTPDMGRITDKEFASNFDPDRTVIMLRQSWQRMVKRSWCGRDVRQGEYYITPSSFCCLEYGMLGSEIGKEGQAATEC